MRYVKSMLFTVRRNWGRLCVITVLFAAVLAAAGYWKANKDISSEEERNETIRTYLEQVARYEEDIVNSQKAQEEVRKNRDEWQAYVDHATFMKLDSENVYVGNVQFSVTGENVDIWGAIVAMNNYVTQGGLRDEVGEEHSDLGVKYWSELITTACDQRTFSISIMQPTEDLARRAIELIKERVKKYAETISQTYGPIVMVEQDTSVFTKSERGILDTQNYNREVLKNYKTNYSDYGDRIINQTNNMNQYIENNKPDSLEVQHTSMVKTVVMFAVIGLLVGLWIAIGIVLIDYIAGNRVKSEEDVKKLGLEVLGVNDLKKGFIPDAAQTAVGINGLLIHKETLPLLDAPAKDGVALYDIVKSEDTVKVCDEYTNALKDTGCAVSYVDSAGNGADSLKELLGHGSAVIVASAGDSRIDKIQEALRKFDHYGIKCLGALVLK